jgi:hypothetical protein
MKSFNLSESVFNSYSKELAFPNVRATGPGFHEYPTISCTTDYSNCEAKVLSLRSQVGWRWPMSYPNGIETNHPGFDESAYDFLINISL